MLCIDSSPVRRHSRPATREAEPELPTQVTSSGPRVLLAAVVRAVVYIAIILALAAAVALLPGGGTAAGAVGTALSIVFLGTLAWFGARMYRENRMALMSLDDRWRAVLYCAIGVVVVTLAATSKLWLTSAGVIAWFALLGVAAYGFYATWRHAREY